MWILCAPAGNLSFLFLLLLAYKIRLFVLLALISPDRVLLHLERLEPSLSSNLSLAWISPTGTLIYRILLLSPIWSGGETARQ